jgi:hypothetical protein
LRELGATLKASTNAPTFIRLPISGQEGNQ